MGLSEILCNIKGTMESAQGTKIGQTFGQTKFEIISQFAHKIFSCANPFPVNIQIKRPLPECSLACGLSQ